MSNMGAKIEQLCLDFQSVAEEIMRLDLGLDEDIEQLVMCQAKQQNLREEMAQLRAATNQTLLSETSKGIIAECLRLEACIYNKLSIQKDDLREKIAKIKMGGMAKTAYSNTYTQMDGYFIDKHK